MNDHREPDPDRIAAAVLACPQVAGLHGGRFGEVATYLPGRRVTGIRITPTEVAVHVVARYPAAVTEIDRGIRRALHGRTGGLPVTVVIEDLAVAGGERVAAATVPAGPVPSNLPGDAHPQENLS
ncbi:hypothetical protein [Pseudonocardia nigra]|uniref:hypothetical protein n=1 Tax=Pseudonocardia nigra TaxID=1921578 RepID=UPI001C607820|nr:hypothetical protein [Pseudonocardia nigra]